MANRLRPLVLTALVALAGCQKPPSAVDTATPDASVRAAVAGLKTGDIRTLVTTQVPPAELARMREEWKQERESKPITDADRKQFAETMAELTAPGAEDALYKMLDPHLQKVDAELAAKIPAWIDVGVMFAEGALNTSKEMTEAQKQEAKKSIEAVARWAHSVVTSEPTTGMRLTDRARAKKAIAVVCRSARELKLKTLDEARALELDQALEKFGVVYRGVKELLAIYDLPIDRALDTVKAETLKQEGDTARVAVSYTLLDTPVRYEAELVRIDGHWYGKEMLEHARKARAAVAPGASGDAPAPQPPAPGGSPG